MESSCYNSNDPSLLEEMTDSLSRHYGLFCPPKTSDYTWNIQSSCPSQLYLSTNASAQHKQVVASTLSGASGWNSYPQQTSQPIPLEADKCYYVEAASLHCSGSCKLCFRAKIHSLNWTKVQAVADHEVQIINISSAALNETQVIL